MDAADAAGSENPDAGHLGRLHQSVERGSRGRRARGGILVEHAQHRLVQGLRHLGACLRDARRRLQDMGHQHHDG